MTIDPVTRRSTGLPLQAVVIAPLAAGALAYVADVVVGAGAWVVAAAPQLGLQMYAVATALFCALEGVVVVPMYLMRRRYTHAAAVTAYLCVVAALFLWLGSFRTN